MSLAERNTGIDLLVSLDIENQWGVKEALMELVTGEFRDGLKGLEGAAPEDQKRIVKTALGMAKKTYREIRYDSKVPPVERIEEAYDQGSVTLSDLLKGLGLQESMSMSSRGKGILGWLRKGFRI